MRSVFLIVSLICLVSAIPRVLHYQGKLVDSEGVGINSRVNMRFRLFSSETSETSLWEEELADVVVEKGLFSVELTGFPDSLDFLEEYWIELEVNGERILPREKLKAVPYAMGSYKVSKAIRSIGVSGGTQRTGEIVLVGSRGVTASESGDTIRIVIESGSSASCYEAANFRKSILNRQFTFNFVSCNPVTRADSVLIYTVPSDKLLYLYGVNLSSQKPTGSTGSLNLSDSYIAIISDELFSIANWGVGVEVDKETFFNIPLVVEGGTSIYLKVNGYFYGTGTCGESRSVSLKTSVLIWGYLAP